jgi:hypothetical protein
MFFLANTARPRRIPEKWSESEINMTYHSAKVFKFIFEGRVKPRYVPIMVD